MHRHNSDGWVGMEKFAQTRHEYVDAATNEDAFVLPNGFKNEIAFEELIGVVQEKVE